MFGKLVEVNVRELWRHEQYGFSSWLAQPENIEELNDAIGLTLADIQQEVFVGAYRADLVARDETSNINVIIENQLEATDHDHLGKIITYASGLDADVIVWIVKETREEHRAAIEWLNLKTIDGISFFLIEIHAYKIGDSLPAPKFEVIENPTTSQKPLTAKQEAKSKAEYKQPGLEFWTALNEALVEKGKPFNPRKASTDHWYDVAMGTSEAHLSITLLSVSGEIGLEVYINDNKELFDQLHEHTEAIHHALGFELSWLRMDDKKASRIKYTIQGLDFDEQSNYPRLIDEIIDKIVRMRDVFCLYL